MTSLPGALPEALAEALAAARERHDVPAIDALRSVLSALSGVASDDVEQAREVVRRELRRRHQAAAEVTCLGAHHEADRLLAEADAIASVLGGATPPPG